MSQANPTDMQATVYAESYILHGCQTTAYKKVFPDSKASMDTHHQKASEFHKKEKVRKRIKELQAISKANTEEEFGLTVSQLKGTLLRVINQGFAHKTDAEGNQVPISLPSALGAVKEFNLMDGNHAAIKHKVGGDADNPLVTYVMSPEDYRRIRAEILEKAEF